MENITTASDLEKLKEIGIGVTLNVSDYDTITALQNAGEFDLVTANTTTVGTGDPQDFLGGWYSGNSQNYGYYHNEKYAAADAGPAGAAQ